MTSSIEDPKTETVQKNTIYLDKNTICKFSG